MFNQTDIDRFWANVYSKTEDECWLWLASADDSGYGLIRIKGKLWKAHRFSYFIHSSHPGDKLVCHTCDTPRCCNPKHLFLGTHDDNNRDRDNKGHQISYQGSEHGMSKLTEQDVQEIRCSKLTRHELANKYCVSYVLICKIINRDLWRHI